MHSKKSFILCLLLCTIVAVWGCSKSESSGADATTNPIEPVTGNSFSSTPPMIQQASPVFAAKTPCGETFSITAGKTIRYRVGATDVDAGDVITLKAANDRPVPAGAVTTPELPVDGNPVNSNFTWTPTADQAGEHVTEYRAQDTNDNLTTCEIVVNVSVPNNYPVEFDPRSPCGQTLPAEVGRRISFSISAVDRDSGSLIVLKEADDTPLPAGATVTPEMPITANPVKATFSWTPTAGQEGLHEIRFRAKDDDDVIFWCEINIDVAP